MHDPASRRHTAVSWHAVFATYLPALVIALGAGIALPAVPTLAKATRGSLRLAGAVATAFAGNGTTAAMRARAAAA